MNASKSSPPRWRCFVKGISVTHVIITILPASDEDLSLLVCPDKGTTHNHTDCTDENDVLNPGNIDGSLTPSRFSVKSEILGSPNPPEQTASNISSPTATILSAPRASERCESAVDNSKEGLTLPVYVYDCPLAMLIDGIVNKLDSPRVKDIYQDHTYRAGELVGEDFVTLKSGNDTKPSSPEPKSDDSDNVAGGDDRSLLYKQGIENPG